jgi:large subunit ribosomal protein L21
VYFNAKKHIFIWNKTCMVVDYALESSRSDRRKIMLAVITTGGKQYKVSQDMTISIDRMPVEVGKEIQFDQILLVQDGDKVLMGSDIKSFKVKAMVTAHTRGKKISVTFVISDTDSNILKLRLQVLRKAQKLPKQRKIENKGGRQWPRKKLEAVRVMVETRLVGDMV